MLWCTWAATNLRSEVDAAHSQQLSYCPDGLLTVLDLAPEGAILSPTARRSTSPPANLPAHHTLSGSLDKIAHQKDKYKTAAPV